MLLDKVFNKVIKNNKLLAFNSNGISITVFFAVGNLIDDGQEHIILNTLFFTGKIIFSVFALII